VDFAYDVFISDGGEDRPYANRLCDSLKGLSPSVSSFFDAKSLRAGDDWEARIQGALETSRHLLVLWSDHAVAGLLWRPWSPAAPVADPPLPSEARAIFEEAESYSLGRNAPQDPARAAELYERAAGMGFAPAQNALGRLYENGIGVPKDRDRAIYWYQLAASEGRPDAREALQRLRVAPAP
jgi:TPR repeat protein